MAGKLGHHDVGEQACCWHAFVYNVRRYRHHYQRFALLADPLSTDVALDGEHTRRVVELFAGIFADALEGISALTVDVVRFVMDQRAGELRGQW
jgi:hypothetical protein